MSTPVTSIKPVSKILTIEELNKNFSVLNEKFEEMRQMMELYKDPNTGNYIRNYVIDAETLKDIKVLLTK